MRAVIVVGVAHLVHRVGGQGILARHGAPLVVAEAVVARVEALHGHVGTAAAHHRHGQSPVVVLQGRLALVGVAGVIRLDHLQHL